MIHMTRRRMILIAIGTAAVIVGRELVAGANIVWQDEELERLWSDAVAAQTEN